MLKGILIGMLMTMVVSSVAAAKPIQNEDGSQPIVHWAVVEATDGNMDKMMALAAENVKPYADKESGTYALYGGIDKENPNLLRMMEIYRDDAAYQEHWKSEGFKKYQKEREDILKRLKIMEADPFVLEAKAVGEGSVVRMAKLEINPVDLVEYKKALKEEITKSVNKEAGVLAILATTEREAPNVFHFLEIYQDDAGYKAHINGKYFQKYNKATKDMILSKTLIENQPTKIVLSGKAVK